MGGLQSTLTRLVRDGVAVAHGVHVIGDACRSTSPTYGRGLSFALAHAAALTDTIALHPDDLDQQAHALDEGVGSEIAPYYDEAVVADRSRLEMIHRAMHGTTSPLPAAQPIARHDPQRPSFLDVLGTSFVDAYAWKRFARYQSLLAKPSELYDDPPTSRPNRGGRPCDDAVTCRAHERRVGRDPPIVASGRGESDDDVGHGLPRQRE